MSACADGERPRAEGGVCPVGPRTAEECPVGSRVVEDEDEPGYPWVAAVPGYPWVPVVPVVGLVCSGCAREPVRVRG